MEITRRSQQRLLRGEALISLWRMPKNGILRMNVWQDYEEISSRSQQRLLRGEALISLWRMPKNGILRIKYGGIMAG